MRKRRQWSIAPLFLCVVFLSASASAETDTEIILKELRELKQSVSSLEDKVLEQQEKINVLEDENYELRSTVSSASEGSATGTRQGGRNLSVFNPQIGVVADIVAKATEDSEDGEGNDKISARHVELVLGHDVDPYSRLDATITYSDYEGAHLEEAYVTHWGLPLDLRMRLGRFFQRVGYDSALHIDQLDTVEQSLVVKDLFGEEGYSRSGIEISRFLPLPWEDVVHELSVGLAEGGVGHGGAVFGDTRRRPTFHVHLRNNWDVADETNLDLSGSYLLGSSDEDSSNEVNVFGVHAKLIHNFNAVNRLKIQAEAYFQDRDEPTEVSEHDHGGEDVHVHRYAYAQSKQEEHDHEGEHEHEDEHHADEFHEEEHHHEDEHYHEDEHHEEAHHDDMHLADEFNDGPFGFYALADYRVSPRFAAGFRYDYVEPIALETDLANNYDQAFTGYLTFYQSEFARWRLQYQHLDFADESTDNRFFLQGTFAIGVHKHAMQ